MTEDLVGKLFGRLRILSLGPRAHGARGGYVTWNCICSCGNTRAIRGDSLKRGLTTSCGCLGIERRRAAAKTHGLSRLSGEQAKIYRVWVEMRNRCSNPKNPAWSYYGGRGIRVCTRWEHYDLFLVDIGPRPKGFTIERINNDGNYEPGNCKWASRAEQSCNTRQNHRLEHNGKTQGITAWAREYEIADTTVLARLRRGMSVADALTVPNRRKRNELHRQQNLSLV